MSPKRRDFLKSALFGAGALTQAPFESSAQEEKSTPSAKNPFSSDPVALRRLTPNILCSRIGLGTGVRGGNRQSNLTRMDRAASLDILRYCYDVGIRLYDLADMYGTHGLAREALDGKPRESYTIFTKIWGHRGGLPEEERPDAETVVKRFLKELNTDYLDLVQVHCMMKPNWPSEFARYFDGLERLKEQGLIKAHGVSCHALSAVKTAADEPWVDALHVRMNTTGTRMEGSLEENVAAARRAHENGKGIIVMKVLGEGAIQDAGERKKSIAYITTLDVADVMVVGFESRAQVDEFLANVSDVLKTAEG